MGDQEDVDVGSAPTVAAAEGERPRTPSQQALHDEVRGALFEGKTTHQHSGQVFAGRYRLLSLLGRGGMGEVYRAHDTVLGEDVALKFLPKKYTGNASLMARFVGEARVARRITHPHVCRVHDIGEADGKSYLSMEFIDGEDVSSLLSRIGRLPPEKGYELAQQLCAGLSALHAQGVLHRDLKPSNVMIDGRGQLKILDFGLAAVADELRADELRDGTPAYMAPEQAAGKAVDERSDIYALGLVIYELITGRHAFASREDSTGHATVDRSRTPVDASRHVRNLSPELADVLQACLDPNPEARPQSVLAVAMALPGGDPVAAAIAAGRVPSVDAIAGLKQVGYLAPWLAYACVAAIALSTLLFAVLAPWTTPLGVVQPKLSPDVLRDRAQGILRSAGIDDAPHDSYRHLSFDSAMLQGSPADGRPVLSPQGPSPILFHYRQSPQPIVPVGPVASILDPPLLVAGELRMSVDGAGLLRSLAVMPDDGLAPPGPAYDFGPLLQAAGLDAETLVAAEPRFTPPFYADAVAAWTGTIATTGVQVRVEAASLRDRVVHLEVLTPWDRRMQPDASAEASGGARPYIVAVVVFAALVAIGGLARRSIQRGDADIGGALRVGATVGVLHAIVLAGWGHHGPLATEMDLVFKVVRDGLLVFGAVFLAYVIVEPYARRFLPGTMVSWTRLVSRRWRDPLVARDILVGGAAAAVLIWVTKIDFLTDPTRVPSGLYRLDVVLGARHVVGTLAVVLQDGVIAILALFLLMLLLRVITRTTRRAAVVFVVVLIASSFPSLESGWDPTTALLRVVPQIVAAVIITILMVRFGLLATAATQMIANIYYAFPLTTDLDNWYGSTGFVALVALGVVVWFGLRCVRPAPR